MSGVKDILLRKKNSVITDKTKSAFDVFVASLIDDFKVDDTNDVIQANLNDIDSTVSDENESNESNEFNINSELRENYKNQSNQANQSNQENHNYKIINQANELLKKTKVSNPTMDKFVIKKQLDERYAVATPQSKMFDTPPPNTIDLRNPVANKGIRKSSKENVNKEYENRQDDTGLKENKTKNTKKK